MSFESKNFFFTVFSWYFAFWIQIRILSSSYTIIFQLEWKSNLQIGHLLFCPSHWSTHSTWKRCIQGRRRTSSSCSNSERQIVHLSASSSSPSSSPGTTVLFVNLWGKVLRSMHCRLAPLVTLALRLASIRRTYSW